MCRYSNTKKIMFNSPNSKKDSVPIREIARGTYILIDPVFVDMADKYSKAVEIVSVTGIQGKHAVALRPDNTKGWITKTVDTPSRELGLYPSSVAHSSPDKPVTITLKKKQLMAQEIDTLKRMGKVFIKDVLSFQARVHNTRYGFNMAGADIHQVESKKRMTDGGN